MSHDIRPQIDDAIDRVAREMTSGAPSEHFRRGVMARLESRRPTRFAWPMIAAGIVAMAAIAIVASMAWPKRAPSAHATITMTTPAPIFTPPVAPAPSPEITRASAPRRASSSASSFESTIAGLPPIERPDPITQESIQPARLTIPQLRIEAIVMPPVDDGGSDQN